MYNVSDVLAFLFNLSVHSGIFPDDLKTAVVVPIFKKGESTDKRNYRPISLLPVISKIFEKIIKKQMINFLASTNFLSPNQYGFRQGLSTEDALLKFYSCLMKNLDDKKLCACLFIDITKAFDMVDHRLLLKKLYSIGFRGHIYNWFASYLSGRSQVVKIVTSISDA